MTGMDEPEDAGVAPPRETLIHTESGVFRKADYPWLVALRATVRGGDGGAAADGTPGGLGESKSQLYTVDELEDEIAFTVGKGGRGGSPDVPSGEDGYLMLELYDQMPED